jgi:rfaE bifunctional protein nucleotidyltransferase chain/domain
MNNYELLISKRLDGQQLGAALELWEEEGKTLVFTNGCFDIIHRGHVEYLAKASDLGDILFIGLNSDASVRRIKGPGRPVQDETARARVLGAMFFVDAVCLFDEDTPYELIKKVKPGILVKGKDYEEHEIAGHDIVKSAGGKIVTIDLTEGYSTSKIIGKTKQ